MPLKSSKSGFILKIWTDSFDFFNGLIRKVSRNDRYFWTLTSVFLLFAIPLTVFTVLQIRDLRSRAATNSPCYYVNSSGVAKNIDVTADFKIDVDDVNLISANYSPPGASNYNPKFDLNSDGYVGNADQLIAIQKNNTTCPAYISSFTANTYTITLGSSVNLSWTTQHAQPSIGVLGSWVSGNGNIALSGSATVTPTASGYTTYTIWASNNYGTQSASVRILVNSPPTPTATVNIKAAPPGGSASDGPINIAYNSAATLSWTSSNASSCEASGSWSGSKSTSSSGYSTGNLTSQKTYTLACRNSAGTLGPSDSVTVNVGAAPPPSNPVPTASIRANDENGPITINYNRPVTLEWSSSNVSSCTVDPLGWTGTGGERTTPNLTASTNTFTLSCNGTYGPASDSVVVNVRAQIFPTVTISADNPNLSYNGSTTIRWSSTNANTCVISATGTSTTWTGTNSSHATGNLTQSRTYTAACTRTNEGTTTRSVTVNVAPQGCLINCTPTPVQPPANSGGGSTPTTTAPRVVPRSAGTSRQPVATSDDIKLNFASNDFLQGAMEITIKINDTSFSQKASLNKEGGTLVLSPKGEVSKNKTYILQLSSINSLIQKLSFTYTDNTSVNVATFVTGEFNSDNLIDGNDLGILTETGILSGDSFYDINYDGVVNSVDYSLLLINQGKKGS